MTTVTNPPAPIANDRSAANAASPGAGAALPAGADGAAGKAAFVRAMFARIVPRYDLVNRLMTMGLDRRWRRETAAIARPSGAVALDIATGTGDLALELARQGARRVVGADFCADMLTAAVAKAARAGGAGSRSLGHRGSQHVGAEIRADHAARSLARQFEHFRLHRQRLHVAQRD